jgi:hypothetical protein
VTPRQIRRLIQKGKIPKSALKPKGKRFIVDPGKADVALSGSLSQVHKSRTAAPGKRTTPTKKKKIGPLTELEKRDMTLAECQRLHERYKAALKQLEFDQKSGRLVSADEVKSAAFEIGRSIRDQIMNIAPRLGPILAGESDPNRITKMLHDQFRKALEQLT